MHQGWEAKNRRKESQKRISCSIPLEITSYKTFFVWTSFYAYKNSDSLEFEKKNNNYSNKVKKINLRFCYPLPKRQILDSSKLKELADDSLKFDETPNR